MEVYTRIGASIKQIPEEKSDIYRELPAHNYVLRLDEMKNEFYLDIVQPFDIPSKVYGRSIPHSDRILHTFSVRKTTTGVMLSGEKGSGKTLLAKLISNKALAQGIPTILINKSYSGDHFNAFIQSIKSPVILLFDEFEKVYANRRDQTELLTLLDGVYSSQKLILFTCNERNTVNENMINRPGRIYYMLDFDSLEEEFIVEYCKDKLNDQSQIAELVRLVAVFDKFNFDMLQAVVEEMNRYNETAKQVMQLLNVKPDFSEYSSFAVELQPTTPPNVPQDNIPKMWTGNPFGDAICLEYQVGNEWFESEFDRTEMVRFNSSCFEFVNADGDRLKLTKQKPKVFSVQNL